MDNKKNAVFIILGQSNAVGHKVPMKEQDKILSPMKNVFGLCREFNQSFDNKFLTWGGYTSFGMNLAEEQDNTYSVPNFLASIWQNHIDEGNKNNLPDLYIIQIAIGAQGVREGAMWYPDRKEKLIPGKLGVVDISLFPYTKRIFALLDDSFKRQNKEYEIMCLHWRGGEGEVNAEQDYLTKNLERIYKRIFDDFNGILNYPPTVLHKLVCSDHMNRRDPTGEKLRKMCYINDVFLKLEKHYDNVTVFDPSKAPQFNSVIYGNGLFIEDCIHFTPEVNNWVAKCIFEKYCDEKNKER